MNLVSSQHKRDTNIDVTLMEEATRKIRREMDECRKTVDAIYGEIQSRICISEYESDLLEIKKKFDALSREINLKANIKDVCVLADSKPSIFILISRY